MTLKKAYYAVWGKPRGIKPGVYWAHFDTELRPFLEGTPAFFRKLGTAEGDRLRGLDLLETEGYPWTRQFRPKAEAMHGRCWYCARPMDLTRVHIPESAEDEHQVPQCTRWRYVDCPENIVIACQQCNNDKADRDVNAFREGLARHEQERVVFYGDILRFVRALPPTFGWSDRTLSSNEATQVLSWYRENQDVRFHTWADDLDDYATGLLLLIPPDVFPFALGAPERLEALEAPQRALGSKSEWTDDDDAKCDDVKF